MTTAIRYEDDVVTWSTEQARLLREGRFDLLDIAHLAEEIEDVGKSEQRELANRMAVLLANLLKWQRQPTRRGASWQITIRNQRRGIAAAWRKLRAWAPSSPSRTGGPASGMMPRLRWPRRLDCPIYQISVPGVRGRCWIKAGYRNDWI